MTVNVLVKMGIMKILKDIINAENVILLVKLVQDQMFV
jgi:hypothetical protein